MTIESTTDRKKTLKTDFGFIPVAEAHMLSVNAGVDAHFAVARAQLLENFAREKLLDGVEAGLDADTADHLWFVLGVARALRKASGQEA